MKIALRKCHTTAIGGANKKLTETVECWALVEKLSARLIQGGHEVLIIEGDNNLNDHDQTKKGCDVANNWGADIYLSFHMNDFHNPSARGCEYILYDTHSTKVQTIAKNVMNFMSSLGVPYRREIVNPTFWELKYTAMEACIIELLFTDNVEDVNIWNSTPWNTIVGNIAHAIDSNIPIDIPSTSTDTYYQVVTGSFTNKAYANARVQDLKTLGFDSFIQQK